MGQRTTAIFYGCPSAGLRLHEDDRDEGPGIIDAWRSIPDHGRKQLWLDDYAPEVEEEGVPLLGFWVAVTGDPTEQPGAVAMEQWTLDEIPKLPRSKDVIAAWPEVARVAALFETPLPRPAFWVIEVEVA